MDELVPLHVATTLNVSDKQLLSNLRATLARGGPYLEGLSPVRDRPLVIVGSGPSAAKYFEEVPGEFDVMALNGAYKTLVRNGYAPTYYAQLDARAENVNFLELISESTTFCLCSQVHPDIFDKVAGRNVLTFHINTPHARATFPEPALFLGGSAGTIGMTALALAAVLGYRHLILLGYDSSLTAEGASHMDYQPQNANQPLLPVWLEDRKYWTTPTMADQVAGFFEWSNILHQTFPGLVIDAVGEGLFYDWVANNQVCFPEIAPDRPKTPAHVRSNIRDVLVNGLKPGAEPVVMEVKADDIDILTEAEEIGYKAEPSDRPGFLRISRK